MNAAPAALAQGALSEDRRVKERERSPKLRYLRSKEPPRPSTYSVYSLERAFESAGVPAVPAWMTAPDSLAANVIYKYRWMWNLRRSSAGPVFVSYMNYLEKKTFPFSYWTEIIPYTFDCWPKYYDWWASFYRRERVRIAFITARQSAQYFSNLFPNMTSVWLPEAIDPTEYNASKPWAQRDIDVLEMGRRLDHYHDKIADRLAQSNRIHLYDHGTEKGIFPGRPDLVDGLSRTRILISFPRSQTHPEVAGTVETVTYRYFQAMASKCLIVGHAPQELIDLYGYNPVIEVHPEQEYQQLDWVLHNLDSLKGLAERNYARLLEVGTWKCRVEQVLDVLRCHPVQSRFKR
jgi:hypothetical protein